MSPLVPTPLPDDRENQPPEDVGWPDPESALSADRETGTALWQRIKDEARRELRAGIRVFTSLERPLDATPFERAQYLATMEALTGALRPRDGLEVLLVHQAVCGGQLFRAPLQRPVRDLEISIVACLGTWNR